MKQFITKIIYALVLGIAATSATPASAANGNIAGTVVFLQISTKTTGNNYFLLNSTAGVGKCIKNAQTGFTLVLIPDDDRGKAMISLVQSAQLSGRSLTVNVDDGAATSGTYCFASWIQTQ